MGFKYDIGQKVIVQNSIGRDFTGMVFEQRASIINMAFIVRKYSILVENGIGMMNNVDESKIRPYQQSSVLEIKRKAFKALQERRDYLNEIVENRYIPPKYKVDRIIFNDPATIVFWKDGTKTIVKRKKGEKNNPYHAFTAALAKKLYKTNAEVNRIVNSGLDQKEKEKKVCKNK